MAQNLKFHCLLAFYLGCYISKYIHIYISVINITNTKQSFYFSQRWWKWKASKSRDQHIIITVKGGGGQSNQRRGSQEDLKVETDQFDAAVSLVECGEFGEWFCLVRSWQMEGRRGLAVSFDSFFWSHYFSITYSSVYHSTQQVKN